MRRWFAILLFGACAGAPVVQAPVPEDRSESVAAPAVDELSLAAFNIEEIRTMLAAEGPPITDLFLGSSDEGLCARPGELFELLKVSRRLGHVRALQLSLPDCMPAESLAALGEVELPSLRRLEVKAGVGPRGAEILAGLPVLAQVTELGLGDNPLGREGIAALGHSPQLRGLRWLSLDRTFVDNDAGLALGDTPGWTGLWGLDLSGNLLGPAALGRLGANPALAELVRLDLSSTRGFGEGGERLSALVRAGGLPKLEVLRVGMQEGDPWLAVLAETGRWPGLRELEVRSGRIGPEGALALARATHLTALERLVIEHDRIGPEGGRALAKAGHLAGLKYVDIKYVGLDEAAVVGLIQLLKEPETLVLSGNAVGDAGVVALAGRREWTRLRKLELYRVGFGDDGAVALAEAPQLAGLELLNIGGNRIGERGWRALVGSPGLARVADERWREALALYDSKIGVEDAAREVPRGFELTLTRGSCLGPCPIYTVTLHADGRVEYMGKSSVGVVGKAEGRVEAGVVRLMIKGVEAFVATEPARHLQRDCGRRIYDNPNVVVRVRGGGRTRTYASRELCPGSPAWEGVYKLAARVDALVGTDRWTYVLDPWAR